MPSDTLLSAALLPAASIRYVHSHSLAGATYAAVTETPAAVHSVAVAAAAAAVSMAAGGCCSSFRT